MMMTKKINGGATVVECGLRVGAVLTLVATACLVGFDSETEFVLFLEQRVTYKNLNSLMALVYVDIVAAVYNFTRLAISILLMISRRRSSPSKLSTSAATSPSSSSMAVQLRRPPIICSWLAFIFDQVGVYVTFAATTAAMQHSTMVMTGESDLQWLKWCNKFTRFCVQIGGGLFSSFLASILMALLSFVSAFRLFRLYSSNRFLRLKSSSSPPPLSMPSSSL